MKNYLTIALLLLLSIVNGQTEIYFDLGKSALTIESKQILDSLLNDLTKNDILRISGHTDTIGSSESNVVLSQERAKSVEKYLKRIGSLASFEILFIGEETPKYKDDKHNRRVEITVIKAKTVIAESTTAEIIKSEKHQLTIEQFLTEDKINLKNIQFKPGTNHFYDSTAIEELYLLTSIMDSLSTIKIRVEGHVCCLNDMKLSQLRAKSACDFLQEKGIAKNRFSFVGFSNRKPLLPETSAYNNQQNRRVEVTIIER